MGIKIINHKDISRIIMDEPKTYNSLSFKNLTDLIKVIKKLDKDNNTKVIIIEGAGKGISAGHNLKEEKSIKKKRIIKSYSIYAQNLCYLLWRVESLLSLKFMGPHMLLDVS